jgi:hypothetical protein
MMFLREVFETRLYRRLVAAAWNAENVKGVLRHCRSSAERDHGTLAITLTHVPTLTLSVSVQLIRCRMIVKFSQSLSAFDDLRRDRNLGELEMLRSE